MPIESRKGFKLNEVAKNVLVMPCGFYRGSFAIIMNEAKFKSLPAEEQKAHAKVFGLVVSKTGGKVWDEMDVLGRIARRRQAFYFAVAMVHQMQLAGAREREQQRRAIVLDQRHAGLILRIACRQFHARRRLELEVTLANPRERVLLALTSRRGQQLQAQPARRRIDSDADR